MKNCLLFSSIEHSEKQAKAGKEEMLPSLFPLQSPSEPTFLFGASERVIEERERETNESRKSLAIYTIHEAG